MTSTAGPSQRLARSLLADPGFGPLPALLLILTAVSGVVDAVSICRSAGSSWPT